MAQELGISEKSPNYRNPFKADHSEVGWLSHIIPLFCDSTGFWFWLGFEEFLLLGFYCFFFMGFGGFLLGSGWVITGFLLGFERLLCSGWALEGFCCILIGFLLGFGEFLLGSGGFVLHRRHQALAPLSLKTLNLSFPSCFHLCPPQFFPSADTFQKALREEEKRRRKEEKRKEIRKGPRISRSQSEL